MVTNILKKCTSIKQIINIIVFTTLPFSGKCQINEKPSFYIDFPLFEHPFISNSGFKNLSMEQSMKFTKSFYYSAHFGIEQGGLKYLGKNGKLWSRFIISFIDFAPLPLSNTWMHEEWHRSVLSVNGFASKNSHWQGMVTKVNDEDLVALKKKSPADMVREATSGNEAHYEFVIELEKDQFLSNVRNWNYSLYWGSYIVNSAYLMTSVHSKKGLKSFKNGENENILKRDVNGYDAINAVYDLFKPNEPYELRGEHPSGVGIDRYVEFEDLTNEEKRYLKLQTGLSFLNFIDPNLIGIHGIGKRNEWNITLRHHMTSFGFMISPNVFFKHHNFGIVLSPQLYRNNKDNFFGVNAEFRKDWIKLKASIWTQPENQSFFESKSLLGGMLGLSASYPIKNFRPYLELNSKSEGWVAGNPYLSKNVSARFGFTWSFE